MNLREKYLQAVHRKRHDYIPFYCTLSPPQLQKFKIKYGHKNYQDYFNFPIRPAAPEYNGKKPEKKYTDYLSTWQEKKGLSVGIFGDISLKADDSHFTHKQAIMGGFNSQKEFENYPYPDPEYDFNWMNFASVVQKIKGNKLAVSGELNCTIFEIAWYLRGLEQLLIDMVENPELLEYHLDRITEIRCIQAQKMVQAGVDVLHLGDDIATQRGMLMNPDMWRKYYKIRLKKVIDEARSINSAILIKYHTDGNPEQIIPDLIEIGIDILNPIQPECIEPEFVKNEYGEELTLDGTLGTQTVFPFGSAEDVKKECLHRIRKCGYNGGLVLAPSHVIEPEVPWENIESFINTVQQYNQGSF